VDSAALSGSLARKRKARRRPFIPGAAGLAAGKPWVTGVRVAEIRTFVTLVRTRHFGRAATLLNLSQPAISARLATLEQAVGARLVERGERGFRLTSAGEAALVRFETMLAALDDLEAELSGEPAAAPRTVRIGAIDTVAATFMPHMVEALRTRMPGLMIELHVEGTKPLVEAMERGGYDIVFAVDPALGEELRGMLVCALRMVWAAAPHLVDGGRVFSVDELSRLPIITFPRGTPPYRQIAPYFQDEKVLASKLISSNSLFAIIALAVAGFGVAPLPRVTIADALAARRLVALDVAKPFPAMPVVATTRVGADPALATLLAEQARLSAAAFCAGLTDDSVTLV